MAESINELWAPSALTETKQILKMIRDLGKAEARLGIILDMIDEGCDIAQLELASKQMRKKI